MNKIEADEQQFFTFLSEVSKKTGKVPVKEVVEKCNTMGIDYLRSIKELDLSHCALTEVPESIKALRNLEELKLINNRLTNLPKNLIELDELDLIRLEHNELESFPPSLLALVKKRMLAEKSTDVFLRNNPMDFVPRSIESMIATRPHCDTFDDYSS